MMVDSTANNGVKSVDMTFRIVDSLKKNAGRTVGELIEEFDVSKSTVHRHLNTLESHGYVVREEDMYHIGLRFMEMGRYTRRRKDMYDIAEELTKTIANQTGDRATFIIEENGLGIVLATEIGDHGIFADSQLGERFYLHATSVGKALLADLPQERRDSILARHGLPKLTENTITDRATLLEVLEDVRERGYAINRAERIEGVYAVATSVADENGSVVGAFGVSAPSRRMSEERIDTEVTDLLLDVAEEFELRNQYSEPT